MPTNIHLDLDQGGKDVDQKVYRSMIGSLLYLCASRSDIMLSVCMCARFQANPLALYDEACAAYEDDATSRPHGKGTKEDEEYIEDDDDEDNDGGEDGDQDEDDDYEDE